jgi:stearoyl-CoA desaturase (delta-9 desaturase)
MLRQWWDTDYQPKEDSAAAKRDRFDLRRSVPYIIIHLACLLVLVVGWSPFTVIAAVMLYLVRMFAVTAFYHRYFSHRSFKTSRPTQFVLALLGNTAMQRGPLWWAATHRHHHKHSDGEEDKHSPSRHGFLWAHIGWLTNARNFPTDYDRVPDLAKYPELVFLNRRDQLVPWIFGLLLFITGFLLEKFAPGLGTNGPQLFVWGFVISTVILLHATLFVNSLAHTLGSQRFKTDDDSRNSLLLALVTLGEGWHNNHHRFSHSVRQGFYWWEIDISYYLLRALSWTGLIWDLRRVPAHVYEEGRSSKGL